MELVALGFAIISLVIAGMSAVSARNREEMIHDILVRIEDLEAGRPAQIEDGPARLARYRQDR